MAVQSMQMRELCTPMSQRNCEGQSIVACQLCMTGERTNLGKEEEEETPSSSLQRSLREGDFWISTVFFLHLPPAS